MTLITRYLLKQLTFSTVLIGTVLTVALWLTQSVRFIDTVLNRGLPLSTFFKLVAFLLPDLIAIILPIATLIAVLFTYNRLFVDRELIVMRATGMSNLTITAPPFLLGIGVVSVLLAINLYFLPLSFQHFKTLEHDVKNNFSAFLIQPGEFTNFKNITIYAKERRRTGEMKGILIHDSRRGDRVFTLLAEKGVIAEIPGGVRVVLYKGNRHQEDAKTGKPSILSFEQYSIDITPETQDTFNQRTRKPYERFFGELLNPDPVQNDPKMISKLRAEAHQRLMIPLSVLAFVLIAMSFFLSGDDQRRGRTQKIIMIVTVCALLEIAVLGALNLSTRFSWMIQGGYFLIALASLVSFLKLLGVNPFKSRGGGA